MAKLKLYSYFRSSSSHRVRIALELKKIPFEYHAIHLLKNGGEQHDPSFARLNPMKQIPCLIDGSFVLGQTMAILQYLDDRFPEPRLFPKSPTEKARVIQVCEVVNSGIQPFQNLDTLGELERRFGAAPEVREDWARHWISKGFVGLEKLLEATAGTYAYGDQVSAADLFIVPQVFSAARYAVDLKAFPVIDRVSRQCMGLEAFRRVDPSSQPDTPPA